MSSAPRGLLPLLLLASLVVPAFGQDSDLYTVENSASPCLNLRPQPDADTDPIYCFVTGTHVTVFESVPYWRRVRFEDGREDGLATKDSEPASSPFPTVAPANLHDATADPRSHPIADPKGQLISRHNARLPTAG